MTTDTPSSQDPRPGSTPAAGPSRRSFLGRAALTGAGAAAGGIVAGGAAGFGIARATDADNAAAKSADHPSAAVPFYGDQQAGIATPAQDRLAFAAFDVTTTDPMQLQQLLGSWAAAASLMTQGKPVGPTEVRPQSPPVDTGEALGLSPSQLTVTVGFGPSLFDTRFGLAGKRPAALVDLPAFAGDALDPDRSGGDLCVQACSNDPQVAFHVIRNLARIGRGTIVLRWSQLGFGRTSSTSTGQATPRNLFGFKDGTNNLKAEDATAMGRDVWVGDDTDQDWMRGGTYLVSRRIRMLIESWDADYLADQEKIFGRFKESGAPLTGRSEFDTVQLARKGKDGSPVIDANSHIALAAPSRHGGRRILRRGYSYTDGIDPTTNQLDAGLFFICFNRDPREQFIPIQRTLASNDLMNEYVTHVGSGIFAVPTGVREVGDWFGKTMFGS